MTYRLAEIEVPEADPFAHDRLSRRESVESVATFLNSVSGPFVLAINSAWGTGKTTFVRMLKQVLSSRGRKTALLNAWTNDFASEPLVAFIGEIEKSLEFESEPGRETVERVKKLGTYLARRSLPIAGRMITAGLIDIDRAGEEINKEISSAIGELAQGAITDAIDEYSAEKAAIQRFHELLSSLVSESSENDDGTPLVVFVDELDRCRPTFAVELLEQMKHLFGVENIIFVLSLDKEQLGVSLKSVYGEGLDDSEYLRRFVDIEFRIPPPDTKRFTTALFQRYQLQDHFEKRRKYRELQYDFGTLRDMFAELFEVFELSLRAQEQCVTRLSVAMTITPENIHIFPYLFSTLVVLKEVLPKNFDRYVGGGPSQEVIDAIAAFPRGPAMLSSRTGHIIQANLIVGIHDRFREPNGEMRYYTDLIQNEAAMETATSDDQEIAAMIQRLTSAMNWPSTEHVVQRIEMAYRFER